MVSYEEISALDKSALQEFSRKLKPEDIAQLVKQLSEKADDLRYKALLTLQYRSEETADVFPYFEVFCKKLKDENSYQRNIGALLFAANAKWDKQGKVENNIDNYLKLLHDEKPITVRQCIQSLVKMLPYQVRIHHKIAHALMAIDISQIKETMRKLILFDILTVLVQLRKHQTYESVELYIADALTGGILDKKSMKQIESLL